MDFNDIFYKYTDHNGAQQIMSTRTLRFGRPSEMNDPFDVYIADLFGIDLDEFFQEARDAYFQVLLSDPKQFAAVTGMDVTKALEDADVSKKDARRGENSISRRVTQDR